MRWNVRSTLVSRSLPVGLRALGRRTLWLGALVASSAGLAGCQSTRSYANDVCTLDCTSKPGTAAACDCPPAGCATPTHAIPLPERAPGARPNEVWCKVLIPAVYETVTEEIETVCPSVQREWVPPLMESRVIPVVIVPACTEVIRTPCVTRTDGICAEICPPRTETRVVVRKDACGCGVKSCETIHHPAVMGTVDREVCVQGPGTVIVHTPEVVSANVCEVEVRPGYWRATQVPGVRETRTHVVCRSPERWEWQRDLTCAVPVAPVAPPCLPARPIPAR